MVINTFDGAAGAPAAATPLLVAKALSKSFGGFKAVNQASLTVHQGEIVGLIGPNGAGKTTLFNIVSRFLPADSGTILFKGEHIEKLPVYLVPRRGLVRTFQISRVFSRLTVLENLCFAAPAQFGESLWQAFVGPRRMAREQRLLREKAHELLAYFRLQHMADQYAGSLSGGQRKLLEMARALMTNPDMLLLDEPMAGVNPALKEQLLDHILDQRSRGRTFLIVEHDMDMIMRISDRVIAMAHGEIIADGPPTQVARNPRVVDAYLGATS